jgi:hypothetical protein
VKEKRWNKAKYPAKIKIFCGERYLDAFTWCV